MDRIFLCMKWRSLYNSEYVNVLYNAVRANMTGDFRFECLTDDDSGFVGGIESFTIPDTGCSSQMWRHGAWPKLGVFLAAPHGLTSRALFVDLDTFICGDLTQFMDHPASFISIYVGDKRRPNRVAKPEDELLGTGLFAFNLEEHTQIAEQFQADPQAAFDAADIEQVWVEEHAFSMENWLVDWVTSFKRRLPRPIGVDLLLHHHAPPDRANVVAFHGDPRPITLALPGRKRWDDLLHMGVGQVPWVRDYWLGYGGTLPKS
jgi:hypothetical protein